MKIKYILLLFIIGLIGGAYLLRREPTASHTALIEKYARRAGIDPLLVAGVVFAESSGRSWVVSHKGACGLMQLMPQTAAALAAELELPPPDAEQLKDPELNIRLGTYYLAKLSRLFQGDLYLTLAAYNAGPTRVRKWARAHLALSSEALIDQVAYPETRTYVKRVLAFMRQKGRQDAKVPH